MQATSRQDEMAVDSHTVFASLLVSAASIRCFRKTPSATSYAQKPPFSYSTYLVAVITVSVRQGNRYQSTCKVPTRRITGHVFFGRFQVSDYRCLAGVSPSERKPRHL